MQRLVASSVSLVLLLSSAPAAFAAEQQDPAVMYVLEEQIMDNDAQGNFNDGFQVSRVEFVESVTTYLYPLDFDTCFQDLAPTPPPTYTQLFSDVHVNLWYAPHVCVGMFTGLLNGNRDGLFRPHAGITAAEASKILSKAYGLTYPAKQPQNAPWYAVHMQAMVNYGAIPNTMKPEHMLNRAEVARMFHALRNAERFPQQRLIESKRKSDVQQSAYIIPVAERTRTAGAKITVTSEASQAEMQPIPTDTDTQARTRRAPKISRRQLLENIWNAAK